MSTNAFALRAAKMALQQGFESPIAQVVPDKFEKLCARVEGEILGFDRGHSSEEIDAIPVETINAKFEEMRKNHPAIFDGPGSAHARQTKAPSAKTAMAKLEDANAALARKPKPVPRGVLPAKRPMTDAEREVFKRLSPAQKLTIGNEGTLLNREFQK